jgi:hypothetical protein
MFLIQNFYNNNLKIGNLLVSPSYKAKRSRTTIDCESPMCRMNILRIIVGCIALCLSVGIYRVQES